ncbi:MAG: hypothetical protein HQL31_03155 [Planctomycetes bacterium]|nr:hypothetical protein [Planctomycetota bacterium]
MTTPMKLAFTAAGDLSGEQIRENPNTFPTDTRPADMNTHGLKGFLSILVVFLFASATLGDLQNSIDSAAGMYATAKGILKNSDNASSSEVITLLKKSRQLLMDESDLNEEGEALLGNISSLLYWQYKFMPSSGTQKISEKVGESAPPAITNPPSVPPPPGRDPWDILKEQKLSAFNSFLKGASAYEAKHHTDYYNNMLNYLHLQEHVADESGSKLVMEKSTSYHEKYAEEIQLTLDEALSGAPTYKEDLAKKNYRHAAITVADVLKQKNLKSEAMKALYELMQELKALATIIDIMKNHPFDGIPLSGLIDDMRGVIVNIDDKGLEIVLDKNTERSRFSWEVMDEKAILRVAHFLIREDSNVDLFLMAILNLRLGNYKGAYTRFEKLIREDPGNMLKYRGYLERCESGFRMAFGSVIEIRLQEALKQSKSGNKNLALSILDDLDTNYLNDSLSSIYRNRYYITRAEVLRN